MRHILTPRADFEEDNPLYALLLSLCYESGNMELFWLLHGFRCMGLRIRRLPTGALVLRPEEDPAGCIGFKPGEYDEMKERWLRPWVRDIQGLLDQLRSKVA